MMIEGRAAIPARPSIVVPPLTPLTPRENPRSLNYTTSAEESSGPAMPDSGTAGPGFGEGRADASRLHAVQAPVRTFGAACPVHRARLPCLPRGPGAEPPGWCASGPV